MTIRQKLEALGLSTGDHDADVHLALGMLAADRGRAVETLVRTTMIPERKWFSLTEPK